MRDPTRLVALLVVVALANLVVACGARDQGFDVTADVVSDASIPDLIVLEPEGEGGPWPVVMALHGYGGSGSDMVAFGAHLAVAGAVVFLPTYTTDVTTQEGMTRMRDDVTCAYQVARRVAAEHGGDLGRPFTALGWSLGADLVVVGSLGPARADASGRCPGDPPRPDVVVGLSGCYYQLGDTPVSWFDDLTDWDDRTADVQLVAGDADPICPSGQTDQLAASLRAEGYEVTVTHLAAADHGAPIFMGMADGGLEVVDTDAGEQVVDLVLDAIATAGTATSG